MTTGMKLVIGDKNLSSWSMRPWLLMKQAGISFEEQVMLFDRPEWRSEIVALSPSRRVPALHDGDLVLWDSLAICEFIAEQRPELWPRDARVRAVARAVSAEMHAGFANMRDDLSMDVTAREPTGGLSTETAADVARVKQIWSESLARSGGPFLFGDFSVADAMYAPVVWRFRTYGISIEDPRARAWYEHMLDLPAMREWEGGAIAEVAGAKPKMPSPNSATHTFAVIFSSQRTDHDGDDYEETAARMEELASRQPGYLGIESARNPDGFGITVSYWGSLAAVKAWRDVAEHAAAQARGRKDFYERYEVRVCTVERGYKFP